MAAEPIHAMAFPVASPAAAGPQAAIGRVVLYRPTEAERQGRGDVEYYPAIITRVWPAGGVNLHVLADAGAAFPVTSVEYSDAGRPRTWRWPARS